MNVSIIIPNFNGESLLKKNLPSVARAAELFSQEKQAKVEIIVSDDASSDNSKKIVTESKLPVLFVEHAVNEGFSSNVNRGVAKAVGEILVLLNTDVSPEPRFLFPLLEHFSNEQVFAVGCMDKSIEQGKEKLRGRGVGTFTKGFLMHRAGSLHASSTLWASGGSSAFRRKSWEKLHGFLPLYNPFYWEDIDLSYRAQKAGYRVLFEPKSIVVHSHDEGSIKTQFSTSKITDTAYRNQFLFVWLNITDLSFLLQHMVWLPYHVVTAMIRGDRAFLAGFGRALHMLPAVLSVRSRNKRLFIFSDHEVLQRHS